MYSNLFRVLLLLKSAVLNFQEYHWYLELVAQNLLKGKCEFSIPATRISLNVAQLRDAQKIFPS